MKITKINIISGFLGCGKTTFIKKIIQESSDFSKTVIIENEFGEVSIDGELLEIDGVSVKEINAGCICCSVAGDFSKSILEIKKIFNPDEIIIEPSGVGKLSEITKICEEYHDKFEINKIITILDLTKYFMYLTNFGEFYKDQIKNSNIIVFSRFTKGIEKEKHLEKVVLSIKEINNNLNIIQKEWDDINSIDILKKRFDINIFSQNHSHCGCSDNTHNHHEYDKNLENSNNHPHDHNCNHNHNCECHSDEHQHLDSKFSSITLNVDRNFSETDLHTVLNSFNKDTSTGNIIRAKGSVPSGNLKLQFDFVPEEINIYERSNDNKNYVVIIGEDLNKKLIEKLFLNG
ncbi:CobW family GTP-binding protein [Peptostreptococcus canis]|uniref:Cobalamin biosynthesis protein CobW n=1 Tax=Peptostreptococcus canis TaxID=1159213 RepID=A0ABR6TN51_9FIRM|nr:GTP-binding protein [Peptostreptococcus canis]MBC2576838.1 cobalamin biosynthesis protein CobW [Peptostreptococcus canis]MBP1998941.1 G3E family GTPase [Peptostreptococcus canis]